MENKYFFEHPNTRSWGIGSRYVFVCCMLYVRVFKLKSIWKLLCDDLFPTTCNLAQYYMYYIGSEYHTTGQRE